MKNGDVLFFLSIPIILFIIGVIYQTPLVSSNNGLLGYRTFRSQASEESWNFAQKFSGKVCIGLAFFLAIIIFVFTYWIYPIYFSNYNDVDLKNMVFVLEISAAFILLFAIVEYLLSKKFDESGRPKNKKSRFLRSTHIRRNLK